MIVIQSAKSTSLYSAICHSEQGFLVWADLKVTRASEQIGLELPTETEMIIGRTDLAEFIGPNILLRGMPNDLINT